MDVLNTWSVDLDCKNITNKLVNIVVVNNKLLLIEFQTHISAKPISKQTGIASKG